MRQEIKIIEIIANMPLGYSLGTGQTEVTGALRKLISIKMKIFYE